MKQANKNTVSKSTKTAEADVMVLTDNFKNDLKSSVLVVSLLANLFIFTAYLVIQTTTVYDQQIIGLLLTR